MDKFVDFKKCDDSKIFDKNVFDNLNQLITGVEDFSLRESKQK